MVGARESVAHDGAEGMMQTELARLMDVGKVTLGGLIDRLEASGSLARQPDPRTGARNAS